ncbi:hypothetical protein [Streptomyces johnsoniae]|uniref:Uncharacterized protein n=1 Tax=Streptomyces johnsoniae TaxID=3075532 RepID=A0ABU2S8X3_9ACTN|nr:hypothetical protein [Streptomyces sp. DSM 41886]MDT0445437.1 hypothetical protein [Streptomyces sp. DSM 41886]
MTSPTPRRPAAEDPWAAGAPPADKAERLTSRLRRVVEDLPAWSPEPPGEILVRRPGTDDA